jgi:hypothetical protein
MKSVLASVFLALACCTATAAQLQPVNGPVVLTITGRIDNANANGAAAFDLDMLEALPGRTAVMETPWTEGTTKFEGPLLKALLDEVGAQGKALRSLR